MPGNYIDVEIRAAVDADDLVGRIVSAEPLGAWDEDGVLHLYWREEDWNEGVRRELEAALRSAGVSAGPGAIAAHSVPDRDWNARWAESVQPVRIGRRVVVRQSWNSAEVRPGDIELVIDPKRAFGSGFHATTQLLVEWLEDSISGGERLLDIGAGTGILAMSALRLGAASATAVDNDPVAVECARENAALNGFGPELDLRVADAAGLESGLYDTIVANLDRNTLLAHGTRLLRYLRPGGRALLSGLQPDDADEIAAALSAAGGSVTARREKDGWMALRVERREQWCVEA